MRTACKRLQINAFWLYKEMTDMCDTVPTRQRDEAG